MTTPTTQNILAEVWTAKESLSASFGHDLHATCLALYAEQQKDPGRYVNLAERGADERAKVEEESRKLLEAKS